MWDRFVIRRKMNSFSRRMGWTWAPANPIRAWLPSTLRCNLKCRTCPMHGPGFPHKNSDWEDMRPEVYERVRREVLPGLRDICVSGGGEPFLAPIFDEMLDDMLKTGKRLNVITNGTIFRPDQIERLVRTPSVIVVSLDGTTNETMEYVRGISLDRVLEFLDTIKQFMDRGAHPEFMLQISYVVMRSNIEQMTDCVELAHRYGARLVSFINFTIDGRTDDFISESLIRCPEEATPHWQRAHQRGLELGVMVPPMVFDCRDRSPEEWRQHKPNLFDGNLIRQCPLPWWSVYVEVDGSVKPCCVYNKMLGNLLEQPFREIWNGPKFRELRRTVNTPQMPPICRHCTIQERF